MSLRRRHILTGALGLGVVLVAAPFAFRRIEDELRRILRRNFGDEVADSAEAAQFIADAAAFWNALNPGLNRIAKPGFWMLSPLLRAARGERDRLEEGIVLAFLRSTNVVRASETGADLVYLGLPEPYGMPCANPLSAQWL